MTVENTEIIEGEIVFREILSSFSCAIAYILLEEVSRADAPSNEISRVVLPGISMDKDDLHPIPFRITYPTPRKQKRYTISVLIDIDGDGRISLGDYITTESYSIPYQSKHPLKVYVQRVK
ncbi:MAG: hypothetical protein ACM3S2_12910 [Ignavibacteriales bacterium]